MGLYRKRVARHCGGDNPLPVGGDDSDADGGELGRCGMWIVVESHQESVTSET
jgi:hypothetical protein